MTRHNAPPTPGHRAVPGPSRSPDRGTLRARRGVTCPSMDTKPPDHLHGMKEGGSGSASSEIVVFWARRESVCDGCGSDLGAGAFIRLIDGGARCLECADLDHLVFLSRGDAA